MIQVCRYEISFVTTYFRLLSNRLTKFKSKSRYLYSITKISIAVE